MALDLPYLGLSVHILVDGSLPAQLACTVITSIIARRLISRAIRMPINHTTVAHPARDVTSSILAGKCGTKCVVVVHAAGPRLLTGGTPES